MSGRAGREKDKKMTDISWEVKMKSLICDLCGEKITGEYKEVFNSHTEGLARCTVYGGEGS